MNLFELRELLDKAEAKYGSDLPIVLVFEPGVMEDGFDDKCTEAISDVRVIDDWPLPGTSLVSHECEKPKKLVIFYDLASNLDSSIEA